MSWVLVAGLGVSGMAAIAYLRAQGVRVRAFDTRADYDVSVLRARWPEVEVALGCLPDDWCQGMAQVVLSPGVDPRQDWVRALAATGAEMVGEVELFARALPQQAQVVAITGSNGKSTVTTLVGELLAAQGYRVAVGGNLGTPALALLADAVEVYVLELSSFQLETTRSLRALSATVLNICEDHLDRYDGMAEYIAAKARLLTMTQLSVVNRDDAVTSVLTPDGVLQVGFSLQAVVLPGDWGVQGAGVAAVLGRWQASGVFEPWVSVSEMQLVGRHNWANVLAALALCQPLGLTVAVAQQVLSRFTGLAHRAQPVRVVDEVLWVNDSKGTNVGSTLAAIASLGADRPVVLLAGGLGKGQDFTPLRVVLARYGRALVVFGRDAAQIAEAVGDACPRVSALTLDEAVSAARALAQPGDCVLLSPACASFDQFSGYAQRGEVFMRLVAGLS